MEPPLKSWFPWIIPDVLQTRRFGRATFALLPLASLIEHCRVRPNGDMPSGVAPIRFRAVRRTGLGCAMFSRGPLPGPVWADARALARALRSPGRVCHATLLLSALPVTGAGRAFLPRQALGVFRHSRVSEKRSQTLNSLGGKT